MITSKPPAPLGPMIQGEACTLVIFGAVGDLARRKLVPAIYQLAVKNLLAEDFRILGVGVETHTDESFRAVMRDALGKSDEVKNLDEKVMRGLADRMFWVSANLTDVKAYAGIQQRLSALEERLELPRRNRLFYLAVPPVIFEPIVKNLSSSGLAPKIPDAATRPWRRVVVEKPFGRSLATASALNASVLEAFAEPQIYRIDHYVGKETVQNVLVFRSANAIFEALWSREHISHIEITAAETVGLEGRAKYYESAGVVRDMFQNHLLQLLALTAMEPPAAPTADAVRDEKVKVLRAISPIVDGDKVSAIRAQYTAGAIGDTKVIGYHEEPDVAPASITPTYAALRLTVNTPRWKGVPFFLRSGKRMKKRVSEVAIHFRLPNKLMYEPCPNETLVNNVLVLRIQPNDGVSIGFEVKVPGAALALTPGIEVTPVEMDFTYSNVFGSEVHPAYETLLLDCMIGDATLFTRSDEVEAAWRLTDPLLAYWEQGNGGPPASYAAGSWGPAEADAFIPHGENGHAWRKP